MKKQTPFHLALGVNNIEKAKNFYENVLECPVGRYNKEKLWFDIDFWGHQLVFTYISD